MDSSCVSEKQRASPTAPSQTAITAVFRWVFSCSSPSPARRWSPKAPTPSPSPALPPSSNCRPARFTHACSKT
ncbi:MAG TPA: hypothetical protein DCP26_09675, partial [Brevundimonas sp.]|nr:hypothetical protein [Brevundimonas sp.]